MGSGGPKGPSGTASNEINEDAKARPSDDITTVPHCRQGRQQGDAAEECGSSGSVISQASGCSWATRLSRQEASPWCPPATTGGTMTNIRASDRLSSQCQENRRMEVGTYEPVVTGVFHARERGSNLGPAHTLPERFLRSGWSADRDQEMATFRGLRAGGTCLPFFTSR